MRTPLALLNLLNNRLRTAVAVAGVAFAVLLLFMQLGFLCAVRKSGTQIFDELDFDILLKSEDYLFFTDPRSFPKSRLSAAASHPDVLWARPFYTASNRWMNPKQGDRRVILVLGADPNQPVFANEDIQGKITRHLTSERFILMDTQSRREFGPVDGVRYGPDDLNQFSELGDRRVQIKGLYSLGAGLASYGSVLINDEGFSQVIPGFSRSDVSLGIVKTRPGADADQVVEELRKQLPDDVLVETRHRTLEHEKYIWTGETPAGIIFLAGTLMGAVVGAAIVYQVLSSDIRNRIKEFATLRAMGYGDLFLSGVVMQQATILAVAGYIVGFFLSLVLYEVVGKYALMPIAMYWQVALSVFVLTLFMCLFSGLIALRKVWTADPASLF